MNEAKHEAPAASPHLLATFVGRTHVRQLRTGGSEETPDGIRSAAERDEVRTTTAAGLTGEARSRLERWHAPRGERSAAATRPPRNDRPVGPAEPILVVALDDPHDRSDNDHTALVLERIADRRQIALVSETSAKSAGLDPKTARIVDARSLPTGTQEPALEVLLERRADNLYVWSTHVLDSPLAAERHDLHTSRCEPE